MGQAALLAAGTNLATAIPAAPGYVGTFELAAVTIAASVGIAREHALAFALLVHVTTLLLTSVGGAIALAWAAEAAEATPGPRGATTDAQSSPPRPPSRAAAAGEVAIARRGA